MGESPANLSRTKAEYSDVKKPLDLASCKSLPTLPHVAMRIMEVALSEDASLRELSDVVALDPALSARVLATVNSAFYGFPSEITTLQHAISILGMKAVRNLSLGLLIVQEFSQRGNTLSALASRQLWKRALSAAVIAKMISQHVDPRLAEEAFLIALLQDIGMLALMAAAPEEYRAILGKDLPHGLELCEAEKAVFRTDHMEAGRMLAEKWNFPTVYQDCLGSHHGEVEEVNVKSSDDLLDRLVRFSADAGCLVTSAGDPVATLHLQAAAEKCFAISHEQLEEKLTQAYSHAVALGGIFSVPMGGLRKYTELLQQATHKLSEMGISYKEALARAREDKEHARQVIRELKESNRQLREMAVHDGLTGLFNKESFLEGLQLLIRRSIRYKRSLSLAMIDVDNFKQVNDTHGHQTGDEVLKHIASTILSTARETDVTARFGGEEFVVALDEAGVNEVELIAERFRDAIEQMNLRVGKRRVKVTVSVGTTSLESDVEDVSPEAMIECADKAMYEAKRRGRNQTCHVKMST